jgi:hypothetical protein
MTLVDGADGISEFFAIKNITSLSFSGDDLVY